MWPLLYGSASLHLLHHVSSRFYARRTFLPSFNSHEGVASSMLLGHILLSSVFLLLLLPSSTWCCESASCTLSPSPLVHSHLVFQEMSMPPYLLPLLNFLRSSRFALVLPIYGSGLVLTPGLALFELPCVAAASTQLPCASLVPTCFSTSLRVPFARSARTSALCSSLSSLLPLNLLSYACSLFLRLFSETGVVSEVYHAVLKLPLFLHQNIFQRQPTRRILVSFHS